MLHKVGNNSLPYVHRLFRITSRLTTGMQPQKPNDTRPSVGSLPCPNTAYKVPEVTRPSFSLTVVTARRLQKQRMRQRLHRVIGRRVRTGLNIVLARLLKEASDTVFQKVIVTTPGQSNVLTIKVTGRYTVLTTTAQALFRNTVYVAIVAAEGTTTIMPAIRKRKDADRPTLPQEVTLTTVLSRPTRIPKALLLTGTGIGLQLPLRLPNRRQTLIPAKFRTFRLTADLPIPGERVLPTTVPATLKIVPYRLPCHAPLISTLLSATTLSPETIITTEKGIYPCTTRSIRPGKVLPAKT